MENGDEKGQGAIQHSCGDTQTTVPHTLSHLFLHSLVLPLLFLHQQSFSQRTRQAGCGHSPRWESCQKTNKQTSTITFNYTYISGTFKCNIVVQNSFSLIKIAFLYHVKLCIAIIYNKHKEQELLFSNALCFQLVVSNRVYAV